VGVTRFYKFQPVYERSAEDLAKANKHLDALVKSYAIFSGRKSFNDPFDSKIDIVYPTPQQVLTLLQRPNIDARTRTIMDSWVSNEAFTPDGVRFLSDCERTLNETIDSYPMYCVSSHNTCTLLWSHYASSHTGFCIELEFAAEQPTQVHYQQHIASIALLDCLKFSFKLDANTDLGERIHDALLVKLRCWSYEGEYRWIAGNAMGRVPKGQRSIEIKYDPQQVRAVIFGCRMSPRVKTYIVKTLQELRFTTEFQQAIEVKDCIEVVPFDEHTHL
jgi:hypothetical protein